MASRASSDAGRRIPALPRLGTSWYARGAGYWARRAAQAGFLVLVMSALCGIAFAAYRDVAASLPSGVRPACDVAEAALAVVAVAWGWIAGRRKIRAACADARGARESWSAYRDRQRRAPGLASAGRLVALFVVPFLPGAVAGATAYLFAVMFVAESPAEVGARRELVAKGLPAYPGGA